MSLLMLSLFTILSLYISPEGVVIPVYNDDATTTERPNVITSTPNIVTTTQRPNCPETKDAETGREWKSVFLDSVSYGQCPDGKIGR